MTDPADPTPAGHPASVPGAAPDVPDDRRADPPPPAAVRPAGSAEPGSEAEREAQRTIRSISRLEESN